MIKDNQTKLNHVHVLLDALVTLAAYALAWFIQIGSGWNVTRDNVVNMNRTYVLAAVLIVPLYLVLYGIFHLYTPKRVLGRRREFANILKANIIGLFVITMTLFLGSKNDYLYNFSRTMVALFFVINVAAETAERAAIRLTLRTMRSKGYNQKHILLVGYSRAAEAFIDRVANNPEWGYQVRGILDENREWGTEYRGVKVIGTPRDLKDILELNTLDEIAITLSLNEYKNLEEIVAACEKSGVHTKFIPDYNNIIPTIPQMEDLQGLPIINIRRVPLTNMFNATIKRIVDIFGALVAIVIFSPLMLATVALIKLTSPGPIIFSQERVGLHNRPFKMYKFRSMEVQNPSSEKSKWTTPNDPRVTSVGRFIRKTSIDEMPQFFNILKGDMSLVGPRPESFFLQYIQIHQLHFH